MTEYRDAKLISINPANNTIVGEVPISTPAEIAEKVKRAHEVKSLWKALGIKKRIEILRPLLAAFKQREEELALLITREMGKPITQARNDFADDFDYFQDFLDHGADYIQDEITYQNGQALHRIVYEPRGVTAVIVPWNFPFLNFVWGVIPNLIVGNPVVFKHSEECPLVGKVIEEVMMGLNDLPQGVFSEVYGDGSVGQLLAEQNVEMIWFTGSSVVGKQLFEIAGKRFIKSVLEMGGSNPCILFDDVDIHKLIPRIIKGRFTNGGQMCDAIKRLIVHQPIFDEVVDKLVQQVKKIKIGDPEQADTELGPLAAVRQVRLLESQVNDAIKQGARAMTGAARLEGLSGAYYLPTLLVNVKRNMRVWTEEVFGPVLPIVSFDTEEEAIALANDTAYGLGAIIHSANAARAQRVAAQIDATCIDINEGNHWLPCNPFGGQKLSGMGCEHGRLGFQELCRFKVIAAS